MPKAVAIPTALRAALQQLADNLQDFRGISEKLQTIFARHRGELSCNNDIVQCVQYFKQYINSKECENPHRYRWTWLWNNYFENNWFTSLNKVLDGYIQEANNVAQPKKSLHKQLSNPTIISLLSAGTALSCLPTVAAQSLLSVGDISAMWNRTTHVDPYFGVTFVQNPLYAAAVMPTFFTLHYLMSKDTDFRRAKSFVLGAGSAISIYWMVRNFGASHHTATIWALVFSNRLIELAFSENALGAESIEYFAGAVTTFLPYPEIESIPHFFSLWGAIPTAQFFLKCLEHDDFLETLTHDLPPPPNLTALEHDWLHNQLLIEHLTFIGYAVVDLVSRSILSNYEEFLPEGYADNGLWIALLISMVVCSYKLSDTLGLARGFLTGASDVAFLFEKTPNLYSFVKLSPLLITRLFPLLKFNHDISAYENKLPQMRAELTRKREQVAEKNRIVAEQKNKKEQQREEIKSNAIKQKLLLAAIQLKIETTFQKLGNNIFTVKLKTSDDNKKIAIELVYGKGEFSIKLSNKILFPQQDRVSLTQKIIEQVKAQAKVRIEHDLFEITLTMQRDHLDATIKILETSIDVVRAFYQTQYEDLQRDEKTTSDQSNQLKFEFKKSYQQLTTKLSAANRLYAILNRQNTTLDVVKSYAAFQADIASIEKRFNAAPEQGYLEQLIVLTQLLPQHETALQAANYQLNQIDEKSKNKEKFIESADGYIASAATSKSKVDLKSKNIKSIATVAVPKPTPVTTKKKANPADKKDSKKGNQNNAPAVVPKYKYLNDVVNYLLKLKNISDQPSSAVKHYNQLYCLTQLFEALKSYDGEANQFHGIAPDKIELLRNKLVHNWQLTPQLVKNIVDEVIKFFPTELQYLRRSHEQKSHALSENIRTKLEKQFSLPEVDWTNMRFASFNVGLFDELSNRSLLGNKQAYQQALQTFKSHTKVFYQAATDPSTEASLKQANVVALRLWAIYYCEATFEIPISYDDRAFHNIMRDIRNREAHHRYLASDEEILEAYRYLFVPAQKADDKFASAAAMHPHPAGVAQNVLVPIVATLPPAQQVVESATAAAQEVATAPKLNN